jgi:hypothetical protein
MDFHFTHENTMGRGIMYGIRNTYNLARKPEGKRPLGGPKHEWEDNIKTDLKETEC